LTTPSALLRDFSPFPPALIVRRACTLPLKLLGCGFSGRRFPLPFILDAPPPLPSLLPLFLFQPVLLFLVLLRSDLQIRDIFFFASPTPIMVGIFFSTLSPVLKSCSPFFGCFFNDVPPRQSSNGDFFYLASSGPPPSGPITHYCSPVFVTMLTDSVLGLASLSFFVVILP